MMLLTKVVVTPVETVACQLVPVVDQTFFLTKILIKI